MDLKTKPFMEVSIGKEKLNPLWIIRLFGEV